MEPADQHIPCQVCIPPVSCVRSGQRGVVTHSCVTNLCRCKVAWLLSWIVAMLSFSHQWQYDGSCHVTKRYCEPKILNKYLLGLGVVVVLFWLWLWLRATPTPITTPNHCQDFGVVVVLLYFDSDWGLMTESDSDSDSWFSVMTEGDSDSDSEPFVYSSKANSSWRKTSVTRNAKLSFR